ncbi:MAG: exodeoxyribonuclease III [Alphaproteobacteria bacterium]|nr:exodeoxyribonuclease III [Alphaproteobacteria bacterium]
MKIATWNVNSVRARLPNIVEWLGQMKPDVLLMQEIKCETAAFPFMEFKAAGYEVRALGQKSYNGVAIASLYPVEDVRETLPGDDADAQARYIEATIKGVRVASIYLPNGNPVGTEKYDYKLAWMARLKNHAAALLRDERPVVLGGDYNVIPDTADAHNPKAWENDALALPATRAAWREILHLGYTDIFRALHPDKQNAYTYWDYQAGAWMRDDGIRIDHFLLSPEAADKTKQCFIDRTPRGKDKASDHTPVMLELLSKETP